MDILITGSSTGIGRACALALAKAEHTVWAGVRSPRSFEELTKLHAKGLHPIMLDVTSSDSIRSAVSMIHKKSGTLHALVNNAGLAVGGPIEGLSLEDWRRQFDINFFGVVELTKACLPSLRESKGRIVNISSLSGRLASPFMSPYSSSKFALESFSDSLRREVGKYGVKVAIIEPGPIRTPIWKKAQREAEERKPSFGKAVMEIYGDSMEKFLRGLEKSAANAAPVSMVVEAVNHALTHAHPRTRYPVGRGIGTLTALSGMLPDMLLDKLIRTRMR